MGIPMTDAGFLKGLSPLPVASGSRSADDYGWVPIDEANPLHDELLVDIVDFGIAGEPHYHKDDGTNYPYCQRIEGSLANILVRRSVAEKLRAANARLAEHGCELLVWDAYRPIETQRGIWSFFEAKIRAEMPGATPEEIYDQVVEYVSDPSHFRRDDPSTWPAHSTGAAVDLTFRTIRDRQLANMGARFDEMDERSNSTHFEELLLDNNLSEDDENLISRQLL